MVDDTAVVPTKTTWTLAKLVVCLTLANRLRIQNDGTVDTLLRLSGMDRPDEEIQLGVHKYAAVAANISPLGAFGNIAKIKQNIVMKRATTTRS